MPATTKTKSATHPKYATFEERAEALSRVVMPQGTGKKPPNGAIGRMCVMECVAWVDGTGPLTDAPACASPVLRNLAVRLNDGGWWGSDEERTKMLLPLVVLLAGSRDDAREIERHKAIYAWAVALRMSTATVRGETAIKRIEIAIGKLSAKFPDHAAKMQSTLGPLREATEAHRVEMSTRSVQNLGAAAREARQQARSAADAAAAYAYAYADAAAYAYAYADADAAAYAYADADAADAAYADAYAYADADAYADAYAYAYADAYAYAAADAAAHADADAADAAVYAADAYADAAAYAAYAAADADAYAYADAAAAADAAADAARKTALRTRRDSLIDLLRAQLEPKAQPTQPSAA